MGSLPGRSWVEDHPLSLEPGPVTWRFSVEALSPDAVIVVSDAEFEPDRIHRPGNVSLGARRFHEVTCRGRPISARAFRIAVVTGMAVATGRSSSSAGVDAEASDTHRCLRMVRHR